MRMPDKDEHESGDKEAGEEVAQIVIRSMDHGQLRWIY